MKQLTWYPGTILPYASLWHTLMRATWLNSLRGGEIRTLVEGNRRRDPREASRDADPRRQELVAAALGEPRSVFRGFAVLSQFPSCLRADHLVEGLRWCPECLDGGFHTLLQSIRLAARCPIHATPLVEACPECQHRFRMPIGDLAVQPKVCRCGRTRLLDSCVARQPRLHAEDVAPWAPVERWLRQIADVCCSASPTLDPSPEIRIALTPRWCRDFGIDYPCCFEPEATLWANAEEAGRWSAYRACSGDLVEERSQIRTETPQGHVYRAMARHLRRHGQPNPDRWIAQLIRTVDPSAFAVTMALRPKARAAFNEMLWSRLLEPQAYVHRWPNRLSPNDGSLSGPTLIQLDPSIEYLRVQGSISESAKWWASYHVMAMSARLAWDSASRRTQRSVDELWADWSQGGELLAGRLAWYSQRQGECLKFVGYLQGIEARSFGESLPTKMQRKYAIAEVRQAPCRRLEALINLDCLGWDPRAGWQVCRGARPDDEDVRLVRLLHTGVRTNSLIFKSHGRFVARLVDGVIQVTGDSSREVLANLRAAVIRYRDMYGSQYAASVRRASERAQLQPVNGDLARQAVRSFNPITKPKRFWNTSLAGMANARSSALRMNHEEAV